MSITTFSHPATELNYPAVTVCRKSPYNPDEYVRAVFDNFQLACNDSCTEHCDASCQKTELLRKDFESYLILNSVRLYMREFIVSKNKFSYVILSNFQTSYSNKLWWDHNEGGLIGLMDSWSEAIRKSPVNFKTDEEAVFDRLKKNIAPFYFDHASSHLQNGPNLWYNDVKQAYKNILAGNDMQGVLSKLTGLSSYTEDVTDFGLTETSVISVTKVSKYMVVKDAMENMSKTTCLNLALCHQMRIKVCIEN